MGIMVKRRKVYKVKTIDQREGVAYDGWEETSLS